jgi:hydroxymethylpyrimidine pyrophosphatase-like HAD family hydrolase
VSDLIATDLDRTLIYSRRARALGEDDGAAVCVEMHHGRAISYLSTAAAELFARLNACRLVVPVTTRMIEQYRRVLLPGPPPRYAVAANGGVLLVDGRVDHAWSRRVERNLRGSFPLDQVWDYVGHVCRPEFTVSVRNASGLFCYALVRPAHLPAGFFADVAGWAAERGWRTSLQGRKLYWVPEALTKSAAVARVAEGAGCDRVLAAGDSLLDVDLLLHADRGIHPRHGELYEQGWSAPHVVCAQASGIRAAEAVLTWLDRECIPG